MHPPKFPVSHMNGIHMPCGQAAHAGVALLQTPGAPTPPEPPIGGGPGAGQPTLQELSRRLEREMASEEPALVRPRANNPVEVAAV